MAGSRRWADPTPTTRLNKFSLVKQSIKDAKDALVAMNAVIT